MTAYSEPDERRASKEASAWFVLMQEEPDDQALWAEFEAWRTASTCNAEAWDVMQRTLGIIKQMPAQNTANWQTAERYAPRRQWYRRPVMQGGALAFAVAACLALVIFPRVVLHFTADCLTGTSETRNVALADGSTVRLAPQSAIAIDYSGQQRRIHLLAGEAFFSVQHDSGRPFVVTAGTVSTTDIGTAFDVRRQPEAVRVAVSEGRVKVEDRAFPQSRAEIGAGETVEVGMGGMRHGTILPDHVAAWGRGLLVADEEPMAEVVDRLRPWLKARVIMASRQSQRHITGVYNFASPENALSAIAQAQGAEIYHFSPWLIVIR